MTYAIGQKFHHTGQFEEDYILAQIGPKQVALIGLESGNRWTEAFPVEKVDAITADEFDAIAWKQPEDFELIRV